MVKKILLMVSVLGVSTLFANEGTFISAYAGGIEYEKSNKDKAVIGGVFLSQSFLPIGEPFKVSIDAEKTIIKYQENLSIPKWIQTDLTGKLDFYYGYNWDFSLGGHKIFMNSNKEDKIWSSFIGAQYYKYGLFNVGVDCFYSYYNTADTKLKIFQASPYFGAYLLNPYSNIAKYIGSYYAEITTNYQIFNNKDSFGKDRYSSEEIKIINYHNNWSLELKGEIGTSAYKILNKGYVMRNQTEQTTYSMGVKLNINITPLISLSASYSRSKVKYTDGTEGYNNIGLVFVNATF